MFKKGDLFIEATPTLSDREMVPCDKQLREWVSVNKLKGQQLVVCVCQAYVLLLGPSGEQAGYGLLMALSLPKRNRDGSSGAPDESGI